MGVQKSKYPDFNEVIGMASKLFKDVQKSVCEIAGDYKTKRKEAAAQEAAENAAKDAAAAAAASATATAEVKPDFKASTTPDKVAPAEVKVDIKADKPVVDTAQEPELVKDEPIVVSEEITEVKIEKTDDKTQ